VPGNVTSLHVLYSQPTHYIVEKRPPYSSRVSPPKAHATHPSVEYEEALEDVMPAIVVTGTHLSLRRSCYHLPAEVLLEKLRAFQHTTRAQSDSSRRPALWTHGGLGSTPSAVRHRPCTLHASECVQLPCMTCSVTTPKHTYVDWLHV
jgi:hypothetical protein